MPYFMHLGPFQMVTMPFQWIFIFNLNSICKFLYCTIPLHSPPPQKKTLSKWEIFKRKILNCKFQTLKNPLHFPTMTSLCNTKYTVLLMLCQSAINYELNSFWRMITTKLHLLSLFISTHISCLPFKSRLPGDYLKPMLTGNMANVIVIHCDTFAPPLE